MRGLCALLAPARRHRRRGQGAARVCERRRERRALLLHRGHRLLRQRRAAVHALRDRPHLGQERVVLAPQVLNMRAWGKGFSGRSKHSRWLTHGGRGAQKQALAVVPS